jgi:hypothetical protein
MVPDGQKIPKINRNGSNARDKIFKMVRNASKWAIIHRWVGRVPDGPDWHPERCIGMLFFSKDREPPDSEE